MRVEKNTKKTRILVFECISEEYSERESLEMLKSNGEDMKKTTYYEIKKDVKDRVYNIKLQLMDDEKYLRKLRQIPISNRKIEEMLSETENDNNFHRIGKNLSKILYLYFKNRELKTWLINYKKNWIVSRL